MDRIICEVPISCLNTFTVFEQFFHGLCHGSHYLRVFRQLFAGEEDKKGQLFFLGKNAGFEGCFLQSPGFAEQALYAVAVNSFFKIAAGNGNSGLKRPLFRQRGFNE